MSNKLESDFNNSLKKLKSLRLDFDFLRLYDSKSAGGRYIKAQPADYILVYKGLVIFVELKECKTKSIPYSRLTQLPKLLRLSKAGATCVFLISHKGEYFVTTAKKIKKYKDLNGRKSYPFTIELKSYKNLMDLINDKLLKD